MIKLPEYTSGSTEPYQLSLIPASKHRRRWRSGGFSPESQNSLGQMPRHGRLFAKLPGQWVSLRKWLAHQHAAEASRGAPGLAIPEAGGSSRSGSRQIAQDRSGEQSQFRQALDAFIGVHELAMSTDHLLGRERDLLDRPAVLVHGLHRFR